MFKKKIRIFELFFAFLIFGIASGQENIIVAKRPAVDGIYIKYIGPSNNSVSPTAIVSKKLSDSELYSQFGEGFTFAKQFVLPRSDLKKLIKTISRIVPPEAGDNDARWKLESPEFQIVLILINKELFVNRRVTDEEVGPIFRMVEKFSIKKYPDLNMWVSQLRKF
jgi:hypothetical protein